MPCCQKQKSREMPSILQQTKNLMLSVANVLAHAKTSGKIRAETQVVASRVDLCHKCRHLSENNRCSVCGCFIALKAGLQAESCPLHKW
jgi:recombinational DNA repair protein RecR